MNESADLLDDLLQAARPEVREGLARTLALEGLLAKVKGQPPPTLGRYEVGNRLGEGGMGVVYRAWDPELRRTVALKVLHANAARDRILAEARALARLSHENVLVVYDTGVKDDQAWIAMEYVPGGDLRQWRARHPHAPWKEVLRLFVAAARGLAAANAAGVIHRDFKPENMLVGDDGRARVADFGVAHVADLEGGAPEGVAGTPGYVAPEVLAGAPASPASDQYSVCAAIDEVLTDSGAERLPAALAPILARGTQADPTKRWPSVDALADRLEALLGSSLSTDPRDLLIERVQRTWVDRVLGGLARSDRLALPLVEAPDADGTPWAELQAPGTRMGTTDDLLAAFERAMGSLLILAGPGGGKTTALAQLAEALLQSARQDPQQPIPVVLHFATFTGFKGSFRAWIENELVVRYGVSTPRATAWAEADQLTLLLDGLDEVPEASRRRCVEALTDFRDAHPVHTVLTCRENTYAALERRPRLGGGVHIGAPGERDSRRLLAEAGVVAPPDLPLTPLLVSLLRRAGPVPSVELQQGAVYEALVDRALSRPPLDAEQRHRIQARLRWLARWMTTQSESELWLDRLQPTSLPTVSQRALALGLGLGLIASFLLVLNAAAGWAAGNPPAHYLTSAGFSLLLVVVFNRGLGITPMVALSWSARRTLRALVATTALGAVGAIAFAFANPIGINLVLGSFAAVCFALFLGLEPADRAGDIGPGEGLRQSLRTSLLVGPTAGLVTGLVVGYAAIPIVLPWAPPESLMRQVADPYLGTLLAFGAFTGGVSACAAGGTAVLLHVGLRLALALTSPLPLRLTASLDDLAERGLLVRIGGGWMFLHLTLRDHLSRRPYG